MLGILSNAECGISTYGKWEIEEVVVGKDSTDNNYNCAQKPFPDLMPY